MINEKEPAENMSAETERQLSFIGLARALCEQKAGTAADRLPTV